MATDPAARWERWLKRFTNYTVGKNITHASRQKAILLHYAGEDVFDLAESLGIVDETSFEDLRLINIFRTAKKYRV